jgi:capsular exopolysaccharide synthesis family protein
MRTLVFGLLAGLMLGGGSAYLVENLNTSLRRAEEVEALLGVPVLGVVPRISEVAGPGARNPDLASLLNTHSPAAEAYRTLRTNLIFSQAVRTLKTIVVTSGSPSEGKTTTAANLAVAFAQQGIRVLLVDCDLRRARLHKLFGVPREPGLTQLVLGHAPSAELVRGTEVEGLSVLTSGTLPPNPSELLGGLRMRRALEALSEEFDLIVLDTPPLLAAADAAILGSFVDGVVFVVRAGETERGAAKHAVQQLAAVGAPTLGAVLNDPDAKLPKYGGYYYYDYYGSRGQA